MGLVRLFAIMLLAGSLASCGLADSNATFIPSILRQPMPPAPQQEAPPDAKAIVQAGLADLFVQNAHPTQVRVSAPMARSEGHSWNVCVEANVQGLGGNSTDRVMLLVEIADGKIRDRRRAPDGGPCAGVQFEPI